MLQVKSEIFVVIIDFLEFLTIEQCFLCEKDVENGPGREHIASGLNFLPFLQGCDLWSNVAWCPASEKNVIIGVDVGSKAEIDDNRVHAAIASHHDVFRLDVSVHDPLLVDMLESSCQSDHEFFNLVNCEISLFLSLK